MYNNKSNGSSYSPTLVLPRMEKTSFLCSGRKTVGTPREQPGNERRLSEGMKSAWDGKCGNSTRKFDTFCVYAS